MKIYGHPMSTCTRKVLMTAAETNTPTELIVVDFAKGEHKQQPHTDRQPFGRVPALDDHGFALHESRAMARYINDKAKGSLMPADAQGRANVEKWISIETSEFTPHAMKFVFKHVMGRDVDDAALASADESLAKCLGVMDGQLANTPFLAGETFTLADIAFMPYVEYAMATPAKDTITKYPHVVAWWNKVSERPTWHKTVGR
jgi:glutathione S-transferase